MSDKILQVTDASFEEQVLKASGPVLVDFWAEWCGPCKMVLPLLDAAAEEYDGKITIAKVNIDQNPDTPQKFGVRGIPTLLIFKDGDIAATKVGAVTRGQLNQFIEDVL